jgi:hypothetical protein
VTYVSTLQSFKVARFQRFKVSAQTSGSNFDTLKLRNLETFLPAFDSLILSVLRCQFQRTRHGCDPDLASSGTTEDSRTFGRRRAGRIDIIHKKDVAANDFCGTAYCEGSAQIFAALVTGQADLGMRVSRALQKVGHKLEMMRLRMALQRSARNQLRLIEATLLPLGFEEWHGNYEDRGPVEHIALKQSQFEVRLQRHDRVGEHAAQNLDRRSHTIELQQVNQLAQPTFITAVRHGAGEGPVDSAADRAPAQTIVVAIRV